MKKQSELYTTEQPLNVYASPRMIDTLKKCYEMELAFPGKPYGPKDFDGSFIGLYKRGLLDVDMSNKSLKTGRWYVTTKGLQFLVSVLKKRVSVNDPFLTKNINRLKDNLENLQNSINNLKVTSGRLGRPDADN